MVDDAPQPVQPEHSWNTDPLVNPSVGFADSSLYTREPFHHPPLRDGGRHAHNRHPGSARKETELLVKTFPLEGVRTK